MSMPQSIPDTSDHQFVVQDMVANDVERLATIDPLLHQLGFRVRKPITAFSSRARRRVAAAPGRLQG
jgi:hypothetical protein